MEARPDLARRAAAEGLGVFALVFAGCGAIVAEAEHPGSATVPSVGSDSALVYEAVLTAFLMFVIMAVATDTRAVGAAAAIAIGGTVGLGRPLRRPGHRGLDEPGPLGRAGIGLRRASRPGGTRE